MKYLTEFKTKKHFLIYSLMAICIFIVLILPYFLIDQQQYSNHFSLSRFLKMLLASLLGLTLGGLSNTTGVFGGVLLRRLSNAGVNTNSTFIGTATFSFFGIYALKNSQNNTQILTTQKVQTNFSESSLQNKIKKAHVFEKLSDKTKENLISNENTKNFVENENIENSVENDNIEIPLSHQRYIDSLRNLKKNNVQSEDDYFNILFQELKEDNFNNYTIKIPKGMKQYNKSNKNIDLRSEIFKSRYRKDGKWDLNDPEEGKEYAKNKYLKIYIQDKSLEFKNNEIKVLKKYLLGEVRNEVVKYQTNIETKLNEGYSIFSYGSRLVERENRSTFFSEQLTFRAIIMDKASSLDLTNSHRILQVTIIFNQCSDKNWEKKLDLCLKFIEDLK